MKAIRMALLTALMALSLGAFAAPAMADGYVWDQEGVPLEEAHEIDLSGEISLNGEWFPVVCDVDGDATLAPGGGGEITRFDLSNCEYMYGSGYCEGGGSISSTLPWSIHPSHDAFGRPQMLIDDMSFTVEITGLPCTAKPKFTVTNADITATGTDPFWPIGSMEFSGQNEGQSKYTVHGDLTLNPFEVYGVSEG